MAKKKPDDDLDTTTSFADMNVDGFKWYNPNAKKQDESRKNRQKVSRKEYWAMVRGAFAAIAPFIIISVLMFSFVFLLAYFWLK
ncbi:MAG: hypothetical protein K2I29_00460 [Clostridia bacterium]|jgi:hypothetical protein|nr:hypothetical protein [Clostridia bacterium]